MDERPGLSTRPQATPFEEHRDSYAKHCEHVKAIWKVCGVKTFQHFQHRQEIRDLLLPFARKLSSLLVRPWRDSAGSMSSSLPVSSCRILDDLR
jgi:hypothetical protein